MLLRPDSSVGTFLKFCSLDHATLEKDVKNKSALIKTLKGTFKNSSTVLFHYIFVFIFYTFKLIKIKIQASFYLSF